MTTKPPTIGVCGFGRCGSTMVMAMLDAGGVRPVAGSADRSYELPGLETLQGCDLPGRAVKLLDGVQHFDLPKANWRFVWIDRDVTQQAKSFVKFGSFIFGDLFKPFPRMESVIADSYGQDRPGVLARYRACGPVMILRYEDVLADPATAAARLRRFVTPAFDAPGFDTARAAAAVHERTGECKPDLAFECSA